MGPPMRVVSNLTLRVGRGFSWLRLNRIFMRVPYEQHRIEQMCIDE